MWTNSHRCPLRPENVESLKWDLADLIEIEGHLTSQSERCPHHPQLQLTHLVLSGPLEGSSPLLMACHKGELESVKRMIETWGVDVEETAVYYFNWKSPADQSRFAKSTRASPLFVAAHSGNLPIVQYLVSVGADISSRTSRVANISERQFIYLYLSSGLTPLHGSISSLAAEKYDIIRFLLESGADPSHGQRPVWKLSYCDADAIRILLQHGMSVAQHDGGSGTVLHHWARSRNSEESTESSLGIVQLLVEMGADVNARDGYGFTPIVLAAVGDLIPDCQLPWIPNMPVLEFFLKREDIDRKDKIIALELAGAIGLRFLKNPQQQMLQIQYLECWDRALELRKLDSDKDGGQIGTKESMRAPVSGKLIEWNTSAELEEFKESLVTSPSSTADRLLLVVQLRMFSCLIDWMSLARIINSGCVYHGIKEHHSLEYLDFFLVSLDVIIRLHHPCQVGFNLTIDTIIELVKYIASVLQDKWSEDTENFDSSKLLLILKRSLQLISEVDPTYLLDPFESSSFDTDTYQNSLLEIVSLVTRFPAYTDIKELMPFLSKLVLQDGRNQRGENFLLFACNQYFSNKPT